MFIGGQAVLLHGSPRLTHRVDVALGIGPEGIESVLKVCDAGALRPLALDPAGFAQETLFARPYTSRPTCASISSSPPRPSRKSPWGGRCGWKSAAHHCLSHRRKISSC